MTLTTCPPTSTGDENAVPTWMAQQKARAQAAYSVPTTHVGYHQQVQQLQGNGWPSSSSSSLPSPTSSSASSSSSQHQHPHQPVKQHRHHHRKARTPYPAWKMPASEADRVDQGIIRLDVFGPYLKNPRGLLQPPTTSTQQLSSSQQAFAVRQRPNRTRKPVHSRLLLPAYPLPAGHLGGPGEVGVGGRSSSSYSSSITSTASGTAASSPAPGGVVRGRADPLPAHRHIGEAGEQELTFPSLSDKFDYILAGGFVPLSYDLSSYRDTVGAPLIYWKKGTAQAVPRHLPLYDLCTTEEIQVMSLLRLSPMAYLHLKETILLAQFVRPPFKKRDAKSWFRIDVNKTAVLYDWFRGLGWLPSTDAEWEERWGSGELSLALPPKLSHSNSYEHR